MITAPAGSTFEFVFYGFPAGLAGTAGVQLIDAARTVITARTTTGITEVSVLGTPSGIYLISMTAPATPGWYLIISDRGSGGPSNVAPEVLQVT